MLNKIKKIINFKIIFLIVLSFSFFILPICEADSPDAIAVRIVPNPKHYSAMRWYLENVDKKGNPSSFQVDNYRAIKDGRTVYVNIANISGGHFYTNIAIISFNQRSEKATKKIIAKIIDNWEFNANITDPDEKAKIIRDTKRLADLADLKLLIDRYYQQNGHFPQLKAGSYLSSRSISIWPSWQQTLAKELGSELPKDPINKFSSGCDIGDTNWSNCKDPAEQTCWDDKNKAFCGKIPLSGNGEGIKLPSGSYFYLYTANTYGSDYYVCAANFETNYSDVLKFACGSAPADRLCSDGTPINTCSSVNLPSYCDNTANLIDNKCGSPYYCPCPLGEACCSDGSCATPACSALRPCPSDNNPHTIDICQNEGACNAKCAHIPIPYCGDGTCQVGENCSNCIADCGCVSPKICCSGSCVVPACSTDTDCNDSNLGTTDTCHNPGECDAFCSNTNIGCSCGISDNTCPPACNKGNDIDCCPPYDMANLNFTQGANALLADVSLGNYTDTGDEAFFTIPACRVFSSPKIDIEPLSELNNKLAVVYITDSSGSMRGQMGNVKTALKDSIDFLHTTAQSLPATTIQVGLVEFSTGIQSSHELVDIGEAMKEDELESQINTYSADGGTYTDYGLNKGYNAIKNSSADKKVLILFSDGQPSPGHDPSANATSIKNNGVLIYTIAFTNNSDLQNNMCDWSSDNGANCYAGNYSYTSLNANEVYGEITKNIIGKPSGQIKIVINGQENSDNNFSVNGQTTFPLNFSNVGITCKDSSQSIPFYAIFNGGGKIKFSNLKIDYCPPCL